MFLGKRVLIRWTDPQTKGGKWISLQEVVDSRPCLIESEGVVVYEDENVINTISHKTADGDVDGDITIPKSIIVSITELNEGVVHTFDHKPVTSISTTITSQD